MCKIYMCLPHKWSLKEISLAFYIPLYLLEMKQHTLSKFNSDLGVILITVLSLWMNEPQLLMEFP